MSFELNLWLSMSKGTLLYEYKNVPVVLTYLLLSFWEHDKPAYVCIYNVDRCFMVPCQGTKVARKSTLYGGLGPATRISGKKSRSGPCFSSPRTLLEV